MSSQHRSEKRLEPKHSAHTNNRILKWRRVIYISTCTYDVFVLRNVSYAVLSNSSYVCTVRTESILLQCIRYDLNATYEYGTIKQSIFVLFCNKRNFCEHIDSPKFFFSKIFQNIPLLRKRSKSPILVFAQQNKTKFKYK